MPVVTMYRGDDVAQVDDGHAPTYENFLAHGWTLEPPSSAPVTTPPSDNDPETGDSETPEEAEAKSPRRKAR